MDNPCMCFMYFKCDALAKNNKMAKQKFRPTRAGGFSGAKAYTWYVEVLKKRRNAVGWIFCDAIKCDDLLRCAGARHYRFRVG